MANVATGLTHLLALAALSLCPLPALSDTGKTPATGETGAQAPEIRAQLSAQSTTVLSSELAGKITQLPVREGDRFKQGQTLVKFDCDPQLAQLKKTKAVLLAAQKTYAVNIRLLKLNSIGQLEVDLAAAEVAKAQADIQMVKATLKRCAITAPFPGRVAERFVNRYQYVKAGEPLLDILDDRRLEIVLWVPSPWLSWLKPETPFAVFIDENQTQYPAIVEKIGARIDAVSQSIKIFGVIDGQFNDLIPGMSGRALFDSAKP